MSQILGSNNSNHHIFGSTDAADASKTRSFNDQGRDHELTALVTGFGPLGEIPITAGFVARMMPPILAADDPLNSSGRSIIILDAKADFAAIPTDWETIRRTIKQLHTDFDSKIDLWIHLGQWASNMDWVSCERRAFRQDFDSSWNLHMPGKHYYSIAGEDGRGIDEIGPNPWSNVPMGLHSEVPIDATVDGANEAIRKYSSSLHDPKREPYPVRSHNEPGGHACGLTFYESLANCYVNKRKRDVIFVHIPCRYEQSSYERTRDTVLAIIGSAMDALIKRKPRSSAEEIRLAWVMEP